MANRGPTILVVGDDRDERAAITAVLREAGFAVAAHDRGVRAALTRRSFAAPVIALPEDDGVEFRRHLRDRHPGLRALTVSGPAATRLVGAGDDMLVFRPLDPCELLGQVFELVLREEEDRTPHHSDDAELGIAAARL